MIKVFNFDSNNLNNSSDFSCNTYIVGEKNGPCVIIDLGENEGKILNYVKNNYKSCLGILLTHGHFDHIRGIEKFLSIYNCTVFVSREDSELLENSKLNCSNKTTNKIELNLKNIYLLDDEDEINFGNKYYFKVISTPFHTSGSVCYLLKSENALFTGDALFKGSIGRTDLPTGDESLIYKSLNKLKDLNEELIIYPGHGEITTLKHELKTNYYLKKENK